jgi:hypothetical protein
MSDNTRKLVSALGDDPETLEQFKKDPKAVMDKFGVPEDHQKLILADDKDALKKAAGLHDGELRLIIM